MSDEEPKGLAAQLKLSQQLVMTPQLQMAIKLLATRSEDLAALIEPYRADGTLEDLAMGAADPIGAATEAEREDAAAAWEFLGDPAPLPHAMPIPDVWVFGNPPSARANRSATPRVQLAATATPERAREATWLLRNLRQRAKSYERVVAAIVAERPRLAIATSAAGFAPLPIRDLAESCSFHESTVTRIVSACRLQNRHHVFAFTTNKRGIGLVEV